VSIPITTIIVGQKTTPRTSRLKYSQRLRLIATTWRVLPNGFGPFTTCYNRFVRCRFDTQGVLRKACERTQAIRNLGDHAVGFGDAFKKKVRALSDKGRTHHASAFRQAIAQF
jgi:transposase